ncbi:HD-GYP domain-containing protein [Acetivibrio cellulolyticus]|uniref:HD-GYP domain-containing protein n=1 Tax=Acetivibrio cellulolyticus TaxID=35830 RepID=UPI0001E2F62D|nr:HD-GYP domain-containing protein [Acetivibrio cellulolyticus]
MSNKSLAVERINYIFAFSILIISLYLFIRTGSFSFLFFLISSVAYIVVNYIFTYYKSKKPADLDQNSDRYEELNRTIIEQKEKIEEMEDELLSLHDALKIITSTFDLNTIMVYTCKLLSKYAECEWYYLCIVNESTGKLNYKYEYGEACTSEIDKNEIEEYLKEARDGVIDSIQIISDKIKGDTIIIPLSVSNEFVGAIYAGSTSVGSFSKVNFGFLESLANFTAISVKNAEMYNSIYTQKQEIEALYEQAAASNEELNAYIRELDETKVELAKKNNELTRYYSEIQYGYLQTVMSLANSIEAKDPYTRGHCQRVMEISCELARTLGLSENEISDLRYAAILHDIGKIGISAAILNKQGKLTDEEFDEIKKHPTIAYNILKDIEFLNNGLSGILQHHERYDGRGYPNGLKGSEICTFGRILCVADAFDAMTSDRPYRKGMAMEAAIEELKRCKGSQFDPEIVDVLVLMADGKDGGNEVM